MRKVERSDQPDGKCRGLFIWHGEKTNLRYFVTYFPIEKKKSLDGDAGRSALFCLGRVTRNENLQGISGHQEQSPGEKAILWADLQEAVIIFSSDSLLVPVSDVLGKDELAAEASVASLQTTVERLKLARHFIQFRLVVPLALYTYTSVQCILQEWKERSTFTVRMSLSISTVTLSFLLDENRWPLE